MKAIRSAGTVLIPVMAALYPGLFLYAQNQSEILFSDTLRVLAASVVFALLCVLCFGVLFRRRDTAMLASVFSIVALFSYGHVYRFIKTWEIAGIDVGRHRYLAPLMGLLFLLGLFHIARNEKVRQRLVQWSSVAAIALFSFTLIQIGVSWDDGLQPQEENELENPGVGQPNSEAYPDIFYIILDGYARADVMESVYGYDNSAFLEALEERGFFVAAESVSNYDLTLLSLPSSLNMTYLDDVVAAAGQEGTEREELTDLLRHSLVRETLTDRGYELVAFETGYPRTRIYDADDYLEPVSDGTGMNSFENMLLDTTLFRLFVDAFGSESERIELALYPEYEMHRVRIRFILDSLGEIASRPERSFVFAHIVSPHPPFIFDQNGNSVIYTRPFSMEDGDHYLGNSEDYWERYPDQVAYLNGLVLDAIDAILRESESPPYILLQADHGPGAFLEWSAPEDEDIFSRFAILNAYYFPTQDYGELYSAISPVNSFRVLFNQLFDAGYTLDEDRSYFSPPQEILDFRDVTEIVTQ